MIFGRGAVGVAVAMLAVGPGSELLGRLDALAAHGLALVGGPEWGALWDPRAGEPAFEGPRPRAAAGEHGRAARRRAPTGEQQRFAGSTVAGLVDELPHQLAAFGVE